MTPSFYIFWIFRRIWVVFQKKRQLANPSCNSCSRDQYRRNLWWHDSADTHGSASLRPTVFAHSGPQLFRNQMVYLTNRYDFLNACPPPCWDLMSLTDRALQKRANLLALFKLRIYLVKAILAWVAESETWDYCFAGVSVLSTNLSASKTIVVVMFDSAFYLVGASPRISCPGAGLLYNYLTYRSQRHRDD